MASLIQVSSSVPSQPRWEWNTPGVTRMLKESPDVYNKIEQVTARVVAALKADILQNGSSSYGKDVYGIAESASYFANNVRGQVVRSTKRQRGIPLGMVALKASNAIAYEAEHGNIARIAQEFRNAN